MLVLGAVEAEDCCPRELCTQLARALSDNHMQRTWASMFPASSSSLSGAAPREAPGALAWVPSLAVMPRRLARFSSRFALRISTCCSSRRRRSSSGLKEPLALNCVRRCSGMYRSAMVNVARRSCAMGAWWRSMGSKPALSQLEKRNSLSKRMERGVEPEGGFGRKRRCQVGR
jgi:hypothetical protein